MGRERAQTVMYRELRALLTETTSSKFSSITQESLHLIKKLPFNLGKVYSHIFKSHTVLPGHRKLLAVTFHVSFIPKLCIPFFLPPQLTSQEMRLVLLLLFSPQLLPINYPGHASQILNPTDKLRSSFPSYFPRTCIMESSIHGVSLSISLGEPFLSYSSNLLLPLPRS
jgi:hypothetical protein